MNENLNLVEKLKNVPKGTKLWSPICGDCYFQRIDEGSCSPIVCTAMLVNGNYCTIYFTEEGLHFNKFTDGECTLFPSKENRDWATFKLSKAHKHFEPFQKVLVKIWHDGKSIWIADFYSHYDKVTCKHFLVSGLTRKDDDDILLYEGNENKLGKTVE